VFSSCSRQTIPPYPADHPLKDKYSNIYPPSLRPYEIYGVWHFPIPSASGYIEEGKASWYGSEFHNLITSSGEPYDMHAMTAAHKTLPLGTFVKVTRLENGRNVILRINDRGPFVQGRIIDLSYGAANKLDMVKPGTASVRVEAVQLAIKKVINGKTTWQPQPFPDFRYGRFAVQIGAFATMSNAYNLKNGLLKEYEKVRISSTSCRDKTCYRVQIGLFYDLMKANQESENLKRKGYSDAFVVAIDDLNKITEIISN
jgi:rare lipoprotein A